MFIFFLCNCNLLSIMCANKKHIVLFFLIIFFLDFINAVNNERNSENVFARNLNGKKPTPNLNKADQKKPFFRLTATLIIIYILAVIFIGVFIYYFFMCYPILCRKERNYDVVEHSRDTTPTPNIEKVP
ncbi:hypothetical protein PGB90_007876 [Kerria lacca]